MPSDPRLLPFDGRLPSVPEDCFVADTARVVGDVVLGAGTSIWFGAVVRGDVHWIRIGERVNIQDLTMVHVTTRRHATTIGDDVTVGHRAVLHGCTIEARALVGMGAIVMDAAVVGEEAMVGAGALVPPGMIVPPRTLVVGSPAKVVRELRDSELEHVRRSAGHYAALAATYLAAGIGKVASA
jgi:carbonic anhydrase/acetyltransferase-like protein (isoleucine patch superfamily)